ncbi:MAG: 50S ribosomal protein L21 [Candidatus Omnitrophica bacterium]|nr:50S ribosomal protein L21 [Candidatus Omnitrophota bacterium]
MYAIVEVGGRQYKVALNDEIEVNKLDVQTSSTISLDKVLLISDGKKVEVGQPYIKGASVEAEVVGEKKAKKVTIFKFLRRKDSQKKTGHRQLLTQLTIKKINK